MALPCRDAGGVLVWQCGGVARCGMDWAIDGCAFGRHGFQTQRNTA